MEGMTEASAMRRPWSPCTQFGVDDGHFVSRSGHLSRAGRKAVAELQRMVARIAAVGRLCMSVDADERTSAG
jgi:hypothetical protein